jgi:hypothetical protein
MKKFTKNLKVLTSEYMKCSVNGNPKKRLILEDSDNNVYIATTGTDCLCGYISYSRGKTYAFTYHYTRANSKMIIDGATEV